MFHRCVNAIASTSTRSVCSSWRISYESSNARTLSLGDDEDEDEDDDSQQQQRRWRTRRLLAKHNRERTQVGLIGSFIAAAAAAVVVRRSAHRGLAAATAAAIVSARAIAVSCSAPGLGRSHRAVSMDSIDRPAHPPTNGLRLCLGLDGAPPLHRAAGAALFQVRSPPRRRLHARAPARPPARLRSPPCRSSSRFPTHRRRAGTSGAGWQASSRRNQRKR